eukprot:Nitzschia sp. Nitz4//scaffold128_size63911//45439//45903//NITZ4_006224-RA/size63911-snap-gene-0.61-mRNA-1//1//CDS//3329534847//5259//frame0
MTYQLQRFLVAFVLLLPLAQAWVESGLLGFAGIRHLARSRSLFAQSEEADTPCWQTLGDEDCSMDNTYAASFVASEWLKDMPCAEGIEDCELPENLKVPANRQEGGVGDFDVMDFLKIKRAHTEHHK